MENTETSKYPGKCIFRYFATVVMSLTLLACANHPSRLPSSDYDRELRYPDETEHFMMAGKKAFDDPLYGVALRYLDKKYPDDLIDLYVYPIADFAWENIPHKLNQEMDAVIAEIDAVVASGSYQSRSEDARGEFTVADGKQNWVGLKSEFTLLSKEGRSYRSGVYLFLQKDKYIKFRTTFDAELSPGWNGDKVVKELLPEIDVPPESPYLKQIRQQAKDQFFQQLLRAVQQSAE